MDEQQKIKVTIYGVGAMGCEIVREISGKPFMEIVGAIDIDKNIVGKDLGQVANIEKKLDVIVSDEPGKVFKSAKADVTILTAGSLVKDVYPLVMIAVKAGSNVITLAEEMHSPWNKYPDISEKINLEAKKHNVTVVQTGAIPGFFVDRIPVFISQCCYRVNKFRIKRYSDWSMFGKLCMDHLGIGIPIEEGQEKVKNNGVPLHIGLDESIYFIANALGWKLDEIKIIRNLKASEIKRETSADQYQIKIEPGCIYGFNMMGYGIKDGKEVIEMDYTGVVCPTEEERKKLVASEVFIEGDPDLHMRLTGDDLNKRNEIGTTAPVINLINIIKDASSGLLTINDFPLHPPKMLNL